MMVIFGACLFILLPVIVLLVRRLRGYENTLKDHKERLAEQDRVLAETEANFCRARLEIEHMLNNLDEGIFTINPDGTINEQHSLRAETIFGIEDFQHAALDVLFGARDTQLESFKKWLSLISEPRMLKKWRMVERLNPFQQIERNENGSQRIIKINYKPIIQNKRLQKVLVLARDITENVKAELALEKTKAEQDALLQRVTAFANNDKVTIDMFMQDVQSYMDKFALVRTPDELVRDAPQLYRDVHTIKGNAGTFGFHNLAKAAGKIEDQFAKVKEKITPALFLVWTKGYAELTTELARINEFRNQLLACEADRISLHLQGYNELLAELSTGGQRDARDIHQKLYNLNARPLATYCKKYHRLLRDYRRRFNKNLADLIVENPLTMVHRDIMAKFDSSMIHIIRNAVDHGIESNEERARLKKGPGELRIALCTTETEHTLTIFDNGRGIDADFVASKAIERGIISEKESHQLSEHEKLQLIFASGFSTKEQVNDISGRGVGMDVVKESMEEFEGAVRIETEVGVGTTLILTLPARKFSDHVTLVRETPVDGEQLIES